MILKRKAAQALAIAVLATIAFFLLTPTPAKSDAAGPSKEQLNARHASAIADAIFDAEGRCTPGQSGEYGCYQYLPSTWRAYSAQVEGEVIAQTPENERRVTEGMIRLWLDEGESDRAIFLTWNQGTPGPDCYKGVNDHGVAYDSCAYADRGLQFLAARGVQ